MVHNLQPNGNRTFSSMTLKNLLYTGATTSCTNINNQHFTATAKIILTGTHDRKLQTS